MRYSTEQLAATAHRHDLVLEDATFVHLDVAHMGVGGMGGQGCVWGFDPEFLIPNRVWRFRVDILVGAEADDVEKHVEK